MNKFFRLINPVNGIKGTIKAASKFNAFLRKWYRLVTFFLVMQLTGVFWYAIGKGGTVAQTIRESGMQTEQLTAAILELTKAQTIQQTIFRQIIKNDSIQNEKIDWVFLEIDRLNKGAQ